ncbi:MAG: hypothetical protein JKX71_05870 [Amylibacter sp.]|nr:hypothetical protein [Amylibacter sp.]
MKKIIPVVTLGFMVAMPSMASAACYVDYKAKQNSGGLKLHYGVMKLPGAACNNNAAAQQVVAKRLAQGGWKLLAIMSRFDKSGLSQRQANAGAYFLKY